MKPGVETVKFTVIRGKIGTMSTHERAQRVRKVEDIVAAIEDIIIDKAGVHVLRSGMDGSFTIAGGTVARMIDAALAEATK